MGGHDFQTEILKHSKTPILDEGLTQQVNAVLARAAKSRSPDTHLQLTELVNPAAAYWKRKRPDITPSSVIRARLSAGKKYHAISRRWFSQLRGYEWEEATLNGAYAGIPGVVGRFDHKVNGNFVEFKTYDKLPASVEDLAQRHPQDVEQVSFYGALSPAKPTQNSLLYMAPAPGAFQFGAFHVRINNMAGVEALLRKRMTDLDQALAKNDPSGLPQCRYLSVGCAYKEANVCHCEELTKETAHTSINAHLTLETNRELAADVHGHAQYDQKPDFVPFSWHLLAPKRGYYWWFSSDEDADEPQVDFIKQGAISCIESSIYGSDLGPTKDERTGLLQKEQFPLLDRRNFIRAYVDGSGKERRLIPLVVKVSAAQNVTAGDRLTGFHIGQLAIAAARYGAAAGAMVTYYRKTGKVAAYTCKFDGEGIKKAIRRALKELTDATEKGSDADLDDCPFFMVDSCIITNCSCK